MLKRAPAPGRKRVKTARKTLWPKGPARNPETLKDTALRLMVNSKGSEGQGQEWMAASDAATGEEEEIKLATRPTALSAQERTLTPPLAITLIDAISQAEALPLART